MTGLRVKLVSDNRPRIIHAVDDDDDVRDSMRVLLESFGFLVRTFASPAEFLRDPECGKADCLLLDLQMPGMTGLELLNQLRTRGVRTPAILITANDDNLESRQARATVLTVLHKPVADDELLQWIERACAHVGET